MCIRDRVTIARALAKNSKMIILDDCLSAVDTETEEEIIKTLRSETEGKTIVVISHRLKAVKDADKIFVFDDGKIVEEGNHDELIVKEGIYYSMYIKPVSYTHLDVYKRQPFTHRDRWRSQLGRRLLASSQVVESAITAR